MDIRTITVIGANGAMGANISAIFAAFGNAKVYMVSRELGKSQEAVKKACKSVRADSIADKLIAADYTMLEDCIRESDLVFESVAEDLAVKQALTDQAAAFLREDAIMCTGTSGLSVTLLAECMPEKMRGRYLGVHFFNPPYNMPLCELIPTKYTDSALTAQMKEYLQWVLYRTVVEVKDAPAFLANRIGFQFINRAMQYAERFCDKGGIDYIDAIFGSFTGRAMAPLTTADFVGLDVHKAIVDNLYENTNDYAHETFRLPDFAEKLISSGKLGRKAGCGLYKMEVDAEGKKTLMVYDIASDSYRPRKKYAFAYTQRVNRNLRNGDYREAFRELLQDPSEEAVLCRTLLLEYIVYGMAMNQQVAFDLHAADAVMATGFHWCPPVAMANAFAEAEDLQKLLDECIPADVLKQTNIRTVLAEVGRSRYDYRPYFKAAR